MSHTARLFAQAVLLSAVAACAASTRPITPAEPSAPRLDANPAPPPATVDPEPTGVLEIRASRTGGTLVEQGLFLRIDGELRGPLPGRFENVRAGERELQIQDEHQRYAVVAERLTVEPEKVVEFAPSLVVTKGLVTIHAADDATGAAVWLRMGSEMRSVPMLPLTIEFPDPSADYAIVAKALDGAERVFPIRFDDGVAVKSLRITFQVSAP